MSICPWCGNGTPKVFCGRPCAKFFNKLAYRLGRAYLYRIAASSDLPLKDAEIPPIPTPGKAPAA